MAELDFVVHDSLIVVGLEADSQTQVIRALGERLQAAGFVKASYVDAAVDREKVYPTGLPTPEPIALPHTDVVHCLKPALAVGLLAQPVAFQMMGDPSQTVATRTVFALSVVDPQRQVQILARLIKFCQSAETIRALHAAGSPADVAARLRRDLMTFEGISMDPQPQSTTSGSSVVLKVVHGVGLHGLFLRLSLTGSLTGVVLAHLIPVLPYVTLIMAAVFSRFDPAFEAQARSLGATPLQTFRAVTLPAILPGFRRVVLRGTPYPTLLRDPGAETDGLLLAVGALVLRRLHAYEGPAYRFRPVHVTVGSVRIPAHAWISPHADPETDWP